jgi:hypothetical protein
MHSIAIVNRDTGNMTTYTPAELRKMAREAVRGLGKLDAHWVTFHESTGRASLVAQYKQRDGWNASTSVAI